jgi:hypothetical protein
VAQWVKVVGSNNSYKPITNTAWVRSQLCKLLKVCTRLAAANDKVYQLLAHGRWFSPGTLASSTAKTGRHDIAEILLKVALKHQKSKSNLFDDFTRLLCWWYRHGNVFPCGLKWLYELTDRRLVACMCCWNVVTRKWKVHKGKIEIISFVVKFLSYSAIYVNFKM